MIDSSFTDNATLGLEMWSSTSLRLTGIIAEDIVSGPSLSPIFNESEANVFLLPQTEQNLNFLVVDDNEINLRIFRKILKRFFPTATVDILQLSTAVDIKSLLQYDIVFLDIEMPEISGVDIARSIRSETTLDSVGLIAVTTRCLLEDVELYRLSGFDHTFPKPVSLRHHYILDQISRVLKSRGKYIL